MLHLAATKEVYDTRGNPDMTNGESAATNRFSAGGSAFSP
jgi:hypothetical protein